MHKILFKVTMARKLTLLLLDLFVQARITVELTWNTEMLSNTCCQSKTQLLMWNFTKGVNDTITEFQWFFNDTTLICLDSKTIGYHVEALYHGRVERIGTAGILLKNVSLTDAGKYTLYVKLAEETIRNVQDISLTVDEQVPYQCRPNIENPTPNVMFCSTSSCERSELSPEWVINGTQDRMGIGRYLAINAGINEQASWCLRGLKCHVNDQLEVCIPNPISSMGFTFKEDVHTSRNFEISTVKGTNYEAYETGDNFLNVLIILAVIMMAFLFLVVVVGYFVCTRRSKFKTFDVKPKISNTAMECTDDLQQVDVVAETTDRSSHDSNSNQNIQIVNNISMAADFVKYIVDTQRLLMTELEALREETRKLKQHNEQSIQLQMRLSYKSGIMTEVICHDHSHNDTDTLETSSNYEDAVSGL